MTSTRPILCILAGGRSRRFGAPKIDIRIDDQPLPVWLASRLRAALHGPCWLSVAPGTHIAAFGGGFDRKIVDAAPHRGPLVAIETVLRAAAGRDVAFVAADMPLVAPAMLSAMSRVLDQRPSTSIVMARWQGGPGAGRVEPFPSMWRSTDALRIMRDASRAGVNSPSALSQHRATHLLPLGTRDDHRAYLNVNRPADAQALQRIIAPMTVTAPPTTPGSA